MQPPGGSGLWGVSDKSISFYRDPHGFVWERRAKYGPVFLSRMLNTPTVFVTSHALTAKVLAASSPDVSTKGAYASFLGMLYGDNVLLCDGDEHAVLHRALMEIMSSSHVQQLHPTIMRLVSKALEDLDVYP